MALIKCKNCGSEISDKAGKCPKCGSAIIQEKKNKSKVAVSIGIAATFIAGVIVGGYSHSIIFDSKEETAVVAEKEPETTDSNEEKEEEDSSEDDNIDESDEDQNESEDIKEVEMNEPMDITHEYGEYTLTVDAVRKCDWLDRDYTFSPEDKPDGKVAILVEMDMKNISFEDPYNEVIFLDDQMELLDENNYCIQSWGTGYDDGEYHMSPRIPVGTNGKIYVPYIVDDTCKKVTITFNNQYKIVADVTD